MTMLKKEIDDLLSKIEAELLEFASFIRSVEDDFNILPRGKFDSRHFPQQSNTSDNNFSNNENSRGGSAIRDAFQIVENILLKISDLLEQFASLPTADEGNLNSKDSYAVKYHYALYVYQIASYLLRIIQEHLRTFSDKLNELASPLFTDEDEKYNLDKEKSIPVKQGVEPQRKFSDHFFQYKTCIPTNLYKPYEQLRVIQCICKHKHSPELPSIDAEVDRNKYFSHKTIREKVKADKEKLSKFPTSSFDDLIRLKESIHELNQLFQILYSRIGKPAKHTQTKLLSTPNEKIVDGVKTPDKRKITKDCCSADCDECCEICRYIHQQKNNECESRKWHFAGSSEIPIFAYEPAWLKSENKQAKQTKPFTDLKSRQTINKRINKISDKDGNCAYGFFTKQTTEDHETQTSRTFKEYPAFTKNASKSNKPLVNKNIVDHKSQTSFKSNESPRFDISQDHFKLLDKCVDIITPGKATRQLSTGTLQPCTSPKKRNKLKKPSSRKIISSDVHNNLPFGLTSFKTKSSQKEDTSEEDGDEEESGELDSSSGDSLQPLFLKDLEEITCIPESKFGGFCLLPGISYSSIPKKNILVEKSDFDAEEHLPRAVMFDITKFSLLLKEKFKDLLEQSSEMSDIDEESSLVFNIVLDSLGSATNFYAEQDEITSDESQSDETEDDFIKEMTQAQMIDTEEKSHRVKEDIAPKDTFAKKSTSGERCLSTHEFNKKSKCRASSHACEFCQSMVKPVICEFHRSHICTKKCVVVESLKSSCSTCRHALERGLTIHQCHDTIPKGLIEIRHMNDIGKICVCYLFWNRRQELDDWRWQKSPFDDPTRVEIEQGTNLENNAILKVIFSPEGTMVKESLAEMQLTLVCDYPQQKLKTDKIASCVKKPSASASTTELQKHYRKSKLTPVGTRLKQQKQQEFIHSQKKLLTKLGRFFDDIQKVGYGTGPPLVLKLRRKSALHDAYYLLTVPSKIRLNYYRNLRALFVLDYHSKVGPSNTNFQDEDEVNELFKLFERELFGSTEKRLFVHPSQEAQCLYFTSDPNAHPQWFEFAGIVLALAILHQKKLDIQFPICLFKCLLDRALSIEDLEEIDPVVYQKLMWMKENDVGNLQRIMTFTIKDKIGNNTYEKELMVNGKKITVTEKNKFRYIDLVVKWKLAERYLAQLRDFRRGFAFVIDPGFLSHFTENELRSLIRQPPDPNIFLKDSSSDKLCEEIKRRETF